MTTPAHRFAAVLAIVIALHAVNTSSAANEQGKHHGQDSPADENEVVSDISQVKCVVCNQKKNRLH
jgi:hypothetical protein